MGLSLCGWGIPCAEYSDVLRTPLSWKLPQAAVLTAVRVLISILQVVMIFNRPSRAKVIVLVQKKKREKEKTPTS
jgi:hypothetical protein